MQKRTSDRLYLNDIFFVRNFIIIATLSNSRQSAQSGHACPDYGASAIFFYKKGQI